MSQAGPLEERLGGRGWESLSHCSWMKRLSSRGQAWGQGACVTSDDAKPFSKALSFSFASGHLALSRPPHLAPARGEACSSRPSALLLLLHLLSQVHGCSDVWLGPLALGLHPFWEGVLEIQPQTGSGELGPGEARGRRTQSLSARSLLSSTLLGTQLAPSLEPSLSLVQKWPLPLGFHIHPPPWRGGAAQPPFPTSIEL